MLVLEGEAALEAHQGLVWKVLDKPQTADLAEAPVLEVVQAVPGPEVRALEVLEPVGPEVQVVVSMVPGLGARVPVLPEVLDQVGPGGQAVARVRTAAEQHTAGLTRKLA